MIIKPKKNSSKNPINNLNNCIVKCKNQRQEEISKIGMIHKNH